MGFYNLELRNEYEFEHSFPKLYEFFKQKLAENKINNPRVFSSTDDFIEVIGFIHPTKNQCYEINYRRNAYVSGYGRIYMNAFMECHLENENIVVDNFHIDPLPEHIII